MGAACVTNPSDLLKVRQQLSTSTSESFVTVAARMFRTEGFLSFYKGLSASLLREASYGAIRFSTYDVCKSTILRVTQREPDAMLVKLGAGMMSGMLGAGLANPADLLKIRTQSLSATGTLRDHARAVIAQRGVAGLYKAVWPTTLRAGVLTASQLGSYDIIKRSLVKHLDFKEGIKTHLASSAAAGFICSAATNGLDVVKVRLMNDSHNRYSGAFACAAITFREEGLLAFSKGFTMCFLRLWPHSVVSLMLYEQLRKAFAISPI
ncbi:uncharacterized protein L969DRAFT_92285 [Mixia osmundae IAM 14324]|uniref:Uncharacterized protein n=1 Tax=Mixia osmundae (strain CBS 9802 / IAM 14324 / JCM 22182 / KY 12970) TaxID=764103 RepID=G7DTE8_MIXOS|nr:uncharacterized protein L969DRAFT_92285 [Mixia osmundae IAM 14324]KEI42867.1 hypothetical protein L969DRAFT_92285 [Mixia osmundae IAM 14324]GAA93795.1 hypothetical protein E5Q_00441 [Mixia osmundae IAM 14324]